MSAAKELYLFQTIRSLLLEGLALQGVTGVTVRQSYQPTQQGAESENAIYLHLITDTRYGHIQRKTLVDGVGDITETDTQQMETTFQVDARVTLTPVEPVNLAQRTAGDLMQLAADIFSSDWAIRVLSPLGIGIYRVQSTRTPFIVNESDRFEAAPSFDVTLTHKRSTTWAAPAVTEFESQLHRV